MGASRSDMTGNAEKKQMPKVMKLKREIRTCLDRTDRRPQSLEKGLLLTGAIMSGTKYLQMAEVQLGTNTEQAFHSDH